MRLMTPEQRELLCAIDGQTVTELLEQFYDVPRRTLLYRLKQLREGSYVRAEELRIGRIRYMRYSLTAKGIETVKYPSAMLMNALVPYGNHGWSHGRSANGSANGDDEVQISLNTNTNSSTSIDIEIDRRLEKDIDTSNVSNTLEPFALRQDSQDTIPYDELLGRMKSLRTSTSDAECVEQPDVLGRKQKPIRSYI